MELTGKLAGRFSFTASLYLPSSAGASALVPSSKGRCNSALCVTAVPNLVGDIRGDVCYTCLLYTSLLDEGFVYPLTKPTSRESIVARDFEERGKTPHSIVTLHQPSALSVVERGSAVINLPEGYGIESPNLVRIPYKSNHHIDYFFVWNRGNENEAFEQFRAFIEQKITEFNG